MDGHVVLLVVVRTVPFPDEWPPILPISRCAINQPCVDMQEMNPYFVVANIHCAHLCPLNSILLFTCRNLWRSRGFPPTNHRRQKLNGTLGRDILRNQEEHRRARLLRPSPTLLHLLQEFHHFSSGFFCQIQRNFGMDAIALHSCFAL